MIDTEPMRLHVKEQYASIMERYDIELDKNHTPH